MTRDELLEHLRKLPPGSEWFVKTEHTHDNIRRGNNLVTVRFWIEEEDNDVPTRS